MTYKWAGATIESVSIQAAWNEQSTNAVIKVVEDPQAADIFRPPPVGHPVKIEIEDWTYEGLLTNVRQTRDFSGNPVWSAGIQAPHELLAGTAVILDALTTPVLSANVANCFGYWEDVLGFGGALNSDGGGMFWDADFSLLNVPAGTNFGVTTTFVPRVGVLAALTAFMSGAGGLWGGPIQYRGNTYTVDFSGLPTPPPYYRIEGMSRTLLDIISQLCVDAGMDYMVTLKDGVIGFKCVSRRTAPVLGTIANYINTQQDCISRSYGVESRGDYTQAIIFGGNRRDLISVVRENLADMTIWPYWGLLPNGDLSEGQGVPEIEEHTFTIDASEIAEFIGNVTYNANLTELRFSLDSYESWAAYVLASKPALAATMQIRSTIDTTTELATVFPDVMFRRDLASVDQGTLAAYGGMNETDFWPNRCRRLYEHIKSYADTYLGRQFLVRLPFGISWTLEPFTTNVLSNVEIIDSAYAPEGSQPLGLPYQDVDFALQSDGLMTPFVAFPLDPTMDTAKLSDDSYLIDNGTLFMKASIDSEVRYFSDQIYPMAVVLQRKVVLASSHHLANMEFGS